ncbi:MAG: response regulator [Lysobacteraceae bacterium]
MNPLHLLLVEDDAVSRGFLNHALQSMPSTVVDTANDATQAIAIVRGHSHALWLLDANLPDASGEQLLHDLRMLRSNIPALCLTAEVQRERLDGLRAAGFVDVLQKPLTIAALHAAVRRAINGSVSASIEQQAQVWDDAQALAALGGNVAAMHAMRSLFIAELPAQTETIARAIAHDDADTVREQLHRLKASCGFVGSLRLLEAVRGLHDMPLDAERAHYFQKQAALVLAAAQPGS